MHSKCAIIYQEGSAAQLYKKPCPIFIIIQHIQMDKTSWTHSIMVLHHRTEMNIQGFCLSGWTLDLTKSLIETNESQFNPFNLCHFSSSFTLYSYHTARPCTACPISLVHFYIVRQDIWKRFLGHTVFIEKNILQVCIVIMNKEFHKKKASRDWISIYLFGH